MNTDDWAKINELFHRAIDLTADEREKVLAGQTEFIRSEVTELIVSHENVNNFIAESAEIELGLDGKSLVGSTVGNYRLIEVVGAGGMGTVFRAEKEGFGKNFAVKLVKRGMDTDAILGRFHLERQILSRLEHPNIARLLDGGTTETGSPFFVMEYVEGIPVTRFCNEQEFDLPERLELFRQICSAVQYAHQNLIIHRDLKPSNILITNDGNPKLLDFGIAKLIDPDNFQQTETQSRMFTPEYASPEQLNGLPITTASDVYSLGVILYQLLSGQRPFKSDRKSYQAIVNQILTEEPVRPSSAVSLNLQNKKELTSENETQKTKSNRTTANPKSKIQNPKSLSGDLDNIVLKSLRKEPERRYQSVQEFSEDIRRHLNGLPVTATADSAFYRFSKFAMRHRRAVFFATLGALLIISTSVVSVWQSMNATREREKAEKRFEQVRNIANKVLFEYHDGIAQLPGATAVREKMVKDSLELLENLSADAGDDIDLQREIVKAYQKVGAIQGASDTGNVGKTNDALKSYQKAAAIQESIISKSSGVFEDLRTLGNLNIDIGLQLRDTGDLSDAESHFQRSKDIFLELEKTSPESNLIKSDLAKIYWNFASLQTAQNDLDRSLENYQKSLELFEKLSASEPDQNRHLRNVALTSKNIGSVLQLRGENGRALTYFQNALKIDLVHTQKDLQDISAQLDLSFTYGTIAGAFRSLGEFENAKVNHQKGIEIREKVSKADEKNVFAKNALARGYQEFGRTYLVFGKYRDAAVEFARADAIFEEISKNDGASATAKVKLAENRSMLAYSNGLTGAFAEANERFLESAAIYKELLDQQKLSAIDQKRFATVYLNFGEILLTQRQPLKAIENLQMAHQLLTKNNNSKDSEEEFARLNELLADAERSSNPNSKEKSSEAKKLYESSLAFWENRQKEGKLSFEFARRPDEIRRKLAAMNI